MLKCHLRQKLESPKSVWQRPPDCRKSSFRRNQAFLNFSISPGTQKNCLEGLLILVAMFHQFLQYIGQHGLNHITVVIIPVKIRTITLSLIHISEPTRLGMISYAVFCLKKK